MAANTMPNVDPAVKLALLSLSQYMSIQIKEYLGECDLWYQSNRLWWAIDALNTQAELNGKDNTEVNP